MNDILSLMPIEVANLLNIIFSPLLAIDPNPQNPAFSILIIAFLVSLISNLAVKYLQNSEKISEIRQELDKHNRRLKEARENNDTEKLEQNQTHILKLQSELMINSFKPMIVTYLPIILMIGWMRISSIQNTIIVLPKIVYWLTLTPLWHSIGSVIYGGHAAIPFAVGWFLWYMICSFSFNQILKNFLGTKQNSYNSRD